MPTRLSAVLLAALFAAFAAISTTPARAADPAASAALADEDTADADAEEQAWVAAKRARYVLLSQQPLPRDRIVAVLQSFPADVADKDAVLADAAAAAPEDRLVQWLAIQLQRGPDANRVYRMPQPQGEPAQRLAQLDADNAAAYLPRLIRAWHDGDSQAVDSTLIAMAAAPRYDSYYFTIVAASVDLWQRFPLPAEVLPADEDPELLYLTLSLTEASMMMPAYQSLVRACDRDALDFGVDLRRYDACADIARRMTAAATWMDRIMGYAVLRKSGQATLADAAARARCSDLQQRVSVVLSDPAKMHQAAPAYVRALLALRDETAAAEVLLAHFASGEAAP